MFSWRGEGECLRRNCVDLHKSPRLNSTVWWGACPGISHWDDFGLSAVWLCGTSKVQRLLRHPRNSLLVTLSSAWN